MDVPVKRPFNPPAVRFRFSEKVDEMDGDSEVPQSIYADEFNELLKVNQEIDGTFRQSVLLKSFRIEAK